MADVGRVNTVDLDDIGKINLMDVPAAGVIVHDTQDKDVDPQTYSMSVPIYHTEISVLKDGDTVIFTVTLNCAQATVVQAVYIVEMYVSVSFPAKAKLQMYIDGVAQGETGYIPNDGKFRLYNDMGNEAVSSGDRTVYLNVHNYDPSDGITFLITGGVYAGCAKL